jgi:hypothetical protein
MMYIPIGMYDLVNIITRLSGVYQFSAFGRQDQEYRPMVLVD